MIVLTLIIVYFGEGFNYIFKINFSFSSAFYNIVNFLLLPSLEKNFNDAFVRVVISG